MAQSVKPPTLDLSSGRDLTARGFEPVWGSAMHVETAWDSLPLLAPPQHVLEHACTHTLCQNKRIHLKTKKVNSARKEERLCKKGGRHSTVLALTTAPS